MGLIDLQVLVTGTGPPVTLLAHGLGASLAETRALASGVPGTKVLYSARGHAGSPAGTDRITYDLLAGDLSAVADCHGATQALGVSMGAGTLLRTLATEPRRFERVALFLPALIDRPRADAAARRLALLASAIEQQDRAAVLLEVLAELPDELGAVVSSYAGTRADFLLGSPGVARVLRELVDDVPVGDRAALSAVTADVLVLAQEGDPLHPAQVARELVGVLPRSRLTVFDRPGVAFRERPRLRALLSEFLRQG